MGKAWRLRLIHLSEWLQRGITPGLLHSQERYKKLLLDLIGPGSDWLDIGCGQRIFAEWLTDSLRAEKELVSRCHTAVGVDSGDSRPHRSLETKYCADVESLPFPNASFSIVTANMVVEHLADPESALREIYRVLRPGGLFVFHTPNARTPFVLLVRMIGSKLRTRVASFIDGRDQEDIFPTFYRLNDDYTIRSKADKIGFRVHRVSFIETAPVLAIFGPVVVLEMVAILLLRLEMLAHLRPDLLVILLKPQGD